MKRFSDHTDITKEIILEAVASGNGGVTAKQVANVLTTGSPVDTNDARYDYVRTKMNALANDGLLSKEKDGRSYLYTVTDEGLDLTTFINHDLPTLVVQKDSPENVVGVVVGADNGSFTVRWENEDGSPIETINVPRENVEAIENRDEAFTDKESDTSDKESDTSEGTPQNRDERIGKTVAPASDELMNSPSLEEYEGETGTIVDVDPSGAIVDWDSDDEEPILMYWNEIQILKSELDMIIDEAEGDGMNFDVPDKPSPSEKKTTAGTRKVDDEKKDEKKTVPTHFPDNGDERSINAHITAGENCEGSRIIISDDAKADGFVEMNERQKSAFRARCPHCNTVNKVDVSDDGTARIGTHAHGGGSQNPRKAYYEWDGPTAEWKRSDQ